MFDSKIRAVNHNTFKNTNSSAIEGETQHLYAPINGKPELDLRAERTSLESLAHNNTEKTLPNLSIVWNINDSGAETGNVISKNKLAEQRKHNHDVVMEKQDTLPERILKNVANESDRERLRLAIQTFKHERLENSSFPISSREYNSVLKDVDALLSPDEKFKHSARMNAEDRTLLAKQILHLASYPYSTDQGRFNTCEMATLEKVLWSREPSAVSGLVRKAALEGKIENVHSHTMFQLSNTPFTKDLEGHTNNPKPGDRLFASQIFQTALIEREWSKRDIGFGVGALKYTLGKSSSLAGDGGERLVMKDGINKGKVLYDRDDNVPITDPGIDFSRIGKIYDSLAKRILNGEPIVLAAESGKSYLDNNHRDSIAFVKNADDLTKRLVALKDRQQLPMIIAVVDKDGDNKDLHVITIRNFDANKNEITLDDQLGPCTKNQKMTPAQLLTRGYPNSMITEDLKPWQLPHPNVRLQRESHYP